VSKIMIQKMPEDMTGTSVTPGAPHLFNINININTTNPLYIHEHESEIFVHIVMQLSYVPDLMSARPYHF
jgi:hypothetical protein